MSESWTLIYRRPHFDNVVDDDGNEEETKGVGRCLSVLLMRRTLIDKDGK